MPKALLSESEFVEMFTKFGPRQMAKRLNISERQVLLRRRRIEGRTDQILVSPAVRLSVTVSEIVPKEYSHRQSVEIIDGIAIVASDAHYWPGPASLMHRALVSCIKEYKPKLVVLNGDVIDAPTISRHPPIGWESRPKLADEIEAAKERLSEIEAATFKARKVWTLGNHDARFSTRIATVAPEYAKIHGVHLSDHFPVWEPAWSCWINDTVVIKHRFKGGIHASHNNTVMSGKSMITGHLHSAKVCPWTDYNGTRYGVDGGCIADTDHKAFVDYLEDNARNWRSAFCILTFKGGRLLIPELVMKWDDSRVQFRGGVFVP